MTPEEKWAEVKTLLPKSDELAREIEELEQKGGNADQIKEKNKDLGDLQIRINGLSDDAYASAGALGGNQGHPALRVQENLFSQLTMIEKTMKVKGGLGASGRTYEIYKYLYRALSDLKVSGETLSDKQEHLLNISENLYYGDPSEKKEDRNPDRTFYSDHAQGREESEIDRVLSDAKSELHETHEKLKERNAEVKDSDDKPVQLKTDQTGSRSETPDVAFELKSEGSEKKGPKGGAGHFEKEAFKVG